MTPLVSLWLPILLSAVGVFLVSSALHMFTGWHKSDYLKVPNEDRVMDTLRPLAIPPGDYMMPRPERSEEHTSELQSRGHLVCRLLLEKKKRSISHDSPAVPTPPPLPIYQATPA